jgi:hypothetical protein
LTRNRVEAPQKKEEEKEDEEEEERRKKKKERKKEERSSRRRKEEEDLPFLINSRCLDFKLSPCFVCCIVSFG